jgi:serine/threonine protein kinase
MPPAPSIVYKEEDFVPQPLKPNTVLRDRYIIKKSIGHGGMGAIYLAEDNRLTGRECAIKEVRQETGIPEHLIEQGREQFYREASVLARLDHPTLPKVSDYFTDADRDYLVMDYIPGDDLKALMDSARRKGQFLPISDILAWASQLIDALEYLHGQNPPVIHRDIKPSNLKLTLRNQIKLVDFGLVKQVAPDELTVTVIQGRGTALYTPLEQYGGDEGHTDVRSDIYSFGATLYHLLTNTPPIEAKQRFLRPGSLPRPASLNPDVSASLEDAVLWAMQLHPDNRPQSIQEFAASLLNAKPVVSMLERTDLYVVTQYLQTTSDRTLAFIAALLLFIAAFATFF